MQLDSNQKVSGKTGPIHCRINRFSSKSLIDFIEEELTRIALCDRAVDLHITISVPQKRLHRMDKGL